ncbi:MAG: 50S ribosomal protein L22 [Verrucomicrobia bacterium]|nr:50S ribosomal protein L22 [Verrucomicrobiota bacterium]
MEVSATTHNIPMSAQKMREVVRQIQGLPALQAQAVLAVVPRKGARVVAKTLASALANAENIRTAWSNAQQKVSDLSTEVKNAHNRKRRNALTRKLQKYESLVDSNNQLKPETLRIKEAVAGTATTLKRFQPKARGSAGPILKRRCHIKITLSDE